MRNDLRLKIIMWLMVALVIVIGVSVCVIVFMGSKSNVSRNHDQIVADVKVDIAKELELDKAINENLKGDALSKTQALIDEVKDDEINIEENNNKEEQEYDSVSKLLNVVVGASKIDVKSGIVVNQDGKQVDNTAEPGDYRAPRVSPPISVEDTPSVSMKLVMTENGIKPDVFTVKQNQAVPLTVSSGDKWSHVFKFKNKNLNGVAIGLGPFETRSIVFNAPKTTGEYYFYDEVGSFEKRGAKGKMVVVK